MDAATIERLARPDSFDHPATQIQVIETHVSWVILTGPYAYKIKKPVNFGFLDFSTLQRRAFCCQEELRLNRRTSEGLYLAVVPVCEKDGALHVNGAGEPVEYAVKMRQFNPHDTLASLLLEPAAESKVSMDVFEKLGYRIGAFHLAAAVADAGSGWGNYESVAAPVEENFRQIGERIAAADRGKLEALAAQAMDMLRKLRPVLSQRKACGFIRELHGDLHAGNIARMDGRWVAFDCIEFNPNLRWIDTASDVAFLVMDLEYRGFPQQASRFLNAYLEYTGDYDLLKVLVFYQSYRAMVRAKVAILRLMQCSAEADSTHLEREFHGYLDYCANLQRRRKLFVVMMMGVSGSGKSTHAKQVAGEWGAVHLRSDAIRKRLYGLLPDAESPVAMRAELYSADASSRTFAEMRRLAQAVLLQGRPVIVDATFIRQSTRVPFMELAREHRIEIAILYCSAPEAELARRIEARARQGGDPSEADVQVMRNQLMDVEMPTKSETGFVINTAESGWMERLKARLKAV